MQMIRSLPFDFVKKLSVGVETNLPQDFIKSVRNDALRATTNHICSIKLWRSIAIDFCSKKKEQKLLYYRAKVEEDASIKKPSIKMVYLHQNEATFALKYEPWILDTANSLSQVHGYQKINFGDGATLKTENTVQPKKNMTYMYLSHMSLPSEFFGLTRITFQSGVLKVPFQI